MITVCTAAKAISFVYHHYMRHAAEHCGIDLLSAYQSIIQYVDDVQ